MSEANRVLAPYENRLAMPADRVAADLERFAELLHKWNAVQNLVSRETVGDLWSRHIADSLQLLPLIRPHDRVLLDIGSGGGFPALPLAIASRGLERRFTLLEPAAKKTAFLRTAARELDLRVSVEALRSDQFDSRETVDIVTSRALAALPDLLGLSRRFFGPQTRGLFHKGREYEAELAKASQLFDFDVIGHPSSVDVQGVVLEISNLRAKTAA